MDEMPDPTEPDNRDDFRDSDGADVPADVPDDGPANPLEGANT